MNSVLINILIVCAIALLVILIVGAIILLVVLFNVRRSVKEVTDKVHAVASLVDIVSLLTGAMHMKGALHKKMPGKGTLVAFAAGLKKGLEVLFKK